METLMFGDNDNVCLSGGADGADLQWGMCAGLAGHSVIHWSFAGHNTKAPYQEVVRLTDEQLEESTNLIKLASIPLKKHPPKHNFVKRLIQRNYFQVAWSDSVYAITSIKDGIAQGGTAWAIYMYLARTDIANKRCYVYDQTKDAWYAFNEGDDPWSRIDSPPVPSGLWAGIGTRDLQESGKAAIRTLLNYEKPQVP